MILGNALKVTHKNCKGMEDFTENIESIFDYYREVLKGVMRLCDIWIEHPANAMAGIMKQAGFGKKTACRNRGAVLRLLPGMSHAAHTRSTAGSVNPLPLQGRKRRMREDF